MTPVERPCPTGKVQYGTAGYAADAATRIYEDQKWRTKRRAKPYKCPDCKMWHLYSPQQKRR